MGDANPKPSPDEDGQIDGPVVLHWSRPTARENGDYLEVDEIGGYEIRYREPGSSNYQTLLINDGWTESYEIDHLVGDYYFTVATFDTDGLYSDFVALQPY